MVPACMAAVVPVLAARLLSTPQSAIMTSKDVSPLRLPVHGTMIVSRQGSIDVPDDARFGMHGGGAEAGNKQLYRSMLLLFIQRMVLEKQGCVNAHRKPLLLSQPQNPGPPAECHISDSEQLGLQ